ncbi:MAG: carbon-nitrogen hydrolase family protein [Treponema sp.]|jgi:predicted amidohydrolase|nr:carbon-nitrogen hydrolase family protein [Treponema sp.]
MRLCLIQEKQNRLYDFAQEERIFSRAEAEKLQSEILEQNFALLENAACNGEFLVSSEAINFCGLPDRLDFPVWDFLQNGYELLAKKIFQFARWKKVWLAIGLYRPVPSGVLYNSVLVINRQGELVTLYDKIHLTGDEKNYLAAGNCFCFFDSEFGKIGLCICWDMQFPEVCRILALRGVRIVLCPTWGWESVYAGCRACENGIYVAGAMAVPYGGLIQGIRTPSSVFNPNGELVSTGSPDKAEVVFCDVDLSREWDIHTIRMEDRRPELYQSLATNTK